MADVSLKDFGSPYLLSACTDSLEKFMGYSLGRSCFTVNFSSESVQTLRSYGNQKGFLGQVLSQKSSLFPWAMVNMGILLSTTPNLISHATDFGAVDISNTI